MAERGVKARGQTNSKEESEAFAAVDTGLRDGQTLVTVLWPTDPIRTVLGH
jgi:hypothetical protein